MIVASRSTGRHRTASRAVEQQLPLRLLDRERSL
jgi:hypothetical protein